RQTFPRPPLLDEKDALRMRCEREQIGVTEALTDGRGIGRHRSSGPEVTRGLILEHHRDPQVAALDALTARVLEQAQCAAQPSPGAPRVSSQHPREADP